jgi:hypothetical protein
MSACIRGREVVVAIRPNRRGSPWTASVICPARWRKSDLLRYVRAEHPTDSVLIEEWKAAELWIANPRDFSDYVRAEAV